MSTQKISDRVISLPAITEDEQAQEQAKGENDTAAPRTPQKRLSLDRSPVMTGQNRLVEQLIDTKMLQRGSRLEDVMRILDRAHFLQMGRGPSLGPMGGPGMGWGEGGGSRESEPLFPMPLWSKDMPVPIGFGQVAPAPRIVARCLSLLETFFVEGGKILEVGAGSGYTTAALALMSPANSVIISTEILPQLASKAQQAVQKALDAIQEPHAQFEIHHQDGTDPVFLIKHGPFTAILVNAAAPTIPQQLIDALSPGGALLMPVGTPGPQHLRRMYKCPDGSVTLQISDVVHFTPLQQPERGTWYEDDGRQLAEHLNSWLANVQQQQTGPVRAIISPHAAYRYCGQVAAHAFKHINPAHVKRVFVLGPSHNMYTRKCVLSTAADYATPIGNVPVDATVYNELQESGLFEFMDLDVDEAEHSLEMQMPFLVHVMGRQQYTLVPIMVGVLDAESEAQYGKIFAKYLDDPHTLFVVSSDFCHWGSRFDYFWYDASRGKIHESVEWLDREGMAIIEKGSAADFRAYLKQYGNTICGRRPISVLLNAMQHCKTKLNVKFTSYDQSSRAETKYDHSVSYAAAVVVPAT